LPIRYFAVPGPGCLAREFLDDQAHNHPMAVAGLTVLEQRVPDALRHGG
jgi:hypothetical protein